MQRREGDVAAALLQRCGTVHTCEDGVGTALSTAGPAWGRRGGGMEVA